MAVDYDSAKEAENVRKHGLSFELAGFLLEDPLLAVVYDRFEGGEHRFHAIGMVGGKCLLLVHTYPDPDDETRIRAISLREATTHERRRYEEESLD